jgi:diguanylate cyclase (GGDEF)-like protein
MAGLVRELVLHGPGSSAGHQTVLQRVRWWFVLLNLVAALLAPLSLSQMESADRRTVTYLLAGAALACWAVALYRTAGRHLLLDLVGPGLVVALGVGAGRPEWVLGPLFLALFLHSLYGTRGGVLRNAGLYVVAYQVLVGMHAGPEEVFSGQLISLTAGVGCMALVMSEMASSLRGNDDAQDREQTVTEASRGLLRATDSQQIAEVAAHFFGRLAEVAGPAPRSAVWWRDGDEFQLAASSGPPVGIEGFELSVLPAPAIADYLDGRPVRLGPTAMAEAGRAAGASRPLDHGVAVPLTDGETSFGMVFIQTNTAVSDDVLATMQHFAYEVSLADRAVRRRQLLAGVVENSADGIVLVDNHERLAFASPAMTELARRAVPVGEPVQRLLSVRSGSDVRPITGVADVGRHASLVLHRADGALLDVEVSARPVQGEGTVLNIRDVSAQRSMQAEISYRAFYDPVTELPNRALFLDRLEHALVRAERDGTRVAVALFDLDDFKAVNDRVGHLAGDRLLHHVGEQVVGRVRQSDTVARLGGDEFALLLEGLTEGLGKNESLSKVLAAVRRPLDVDGHQLSVTASGGIAISTGNETAEQMLGAADLAMYVAKERGKDTAVTYHPELRAGIDERRELRDELELAIEQGELRLHYQPILSLADDTTIGAEALVRWEHPTRGLLGPDRFVPLAEQSGLVQPLGTWVLHTACRDLATWRRTGLVDEHFQLHVNLSVQQLSGDHLVADVEQALARFEIPPGHLVVEVTETALADDPDLAEVTLRQLHRLGVSVAIDDFGTGYASFTYLRRFPVDVVKIDRSFINDVAVGPEEAALARAIVQLAGSLGMATVAEGIENEPARRLLATWGCSQAQGWLWSPALPAHELEDWLAPGPTPHRHTPGATMPASAPAPQP